MPRVIQSNNKAEFSMEIGSTPSDNVKKTRLVDHDMNIDHVVNSKSYSREKGAILLEQS